jgi:hypothetical protein
MAFWCAKGATERVDEGFAGCDHPFVGWEGHVVSFLSWLEGQRHKGDGKQVKRFA